MPGFWPRKESIQPPQLKDGRPFKFRLVLPFSFLCFSLSFISWLVCFSEIRSFSIVSGRLISPSAKELSKPWTIRTPFSLFLTLKISSYSLLQSSNMEISFRYFLIAVRGEYEPAVAPAIKFVTSIGRMKYHSVSFPLNTSSSQKIPDMSALSIAPFLPQRSEKSWQWRLSPPIAVFTTQFATIWWRKI